MDRTVALIVCGAEANQDPATNDLRRADEPIPTPPRVDAEDGESRPTEDATLRLFQGGISSS